MEIDAMNVVPKPIFLHIKDVIKTNDFIKCFVVDAKDEHYDNRKILRHCLSCADTYYNIYFICSISNISSIINCIKEINEEADRNQISIDVSTIISKTEKNPVFLANIYEHEDSSATLSTFGCRMAEDLEEIDDILFGKFVHQTLERDVVVCIGHESSIRFISRIKGSCRYFVGISSSMPETSRFINQGVRVVNRL